MRLPRLPLSAVAAAGLAATALLSGCVIAPARPYPYAYPPGPPPGYNAPEGDVQAPPPPPREEYIGVAPVIGWIWLSGFWAWQANRHIWIGGHWEAPRPGYRWYPHEWSRQGGGWHQRPGYWGR